MSEHLRAGHSVIVDNTNPTSAERGPLVALARSAGARAVSYAFVTTVPEAVYRNALRTGRARIPDAGIYSVAKRLCPVLASEGFDRRFEVQLTNQGFVVTEVLEAEVTVCGRRTDRG